MISVILLVLLSLFWFTQQQAVFSKVKNLLANLKADVEREDNQSRHQSSKKN